MLPAFRVFSKRTLSVEEYVHVIFDDTNTRLQESEVGDDEIDSFKLAKDIQKVSTENIIEEPSTAEAESTTRADKVNIPREWRHSVSYNENFILK